MAHNVGQTLPTNGLLRCLSMMTICHLFLVRSHKLFSVLPRDLQYLLLVSRGSSQTTPHQNHQNHRQQQVQPSLSSSHSCLHSIAASFLLDWLAAGVSSLASQLTWGVSHWAHTQYENNI